jgi:hypothetical protein
VYEHLDGDRGGRPGGGQRADCCPPALGRGDEDNDADGSGDHAAA